MWPKAIAQLVELLPHAARLLPMADKFFTSKNAGEEANRRAMEAMAEGLRGDLGQVTSSHAGLYRQMNDLSEKVGVVGADAAVTRASVVGLEERMTVLEHRMDRVGALLLGVTAMVVAVLVIAIVLLLRVHA